MCKNLLLGGLLSHQAGLNSGGVQPFICATLVEVASVLLLGRSRRIRLFPISRVLLRCRNAPIDAFIAIILAPR